MGRTSAGAVLGAAVGGLAAIIAEFTPLGIVATSAAAAGIGSYIASSKYAPKYQYK